MADVMQRCVPVSTGAIGPDLRVNYQFGLVLGVDEFEQEDLYFRERDERAARALHGYGTASGLHVTAARPVADPAEVEVRVEPGIAVDQYGRPVVIRTAQCARVGAWLAAQEADAAAHQQPSPLQAHLRPSGDVTLYVVAEYSSCPDALVPLPGNPCGSDDDVTAPSRIRDSWNLSLRWAPPPMPHWDGVRALADLLLPIELHDGSPLESDEPVLADHVRALAPGAPAPRVPLPPAPILPRRDARAALDRLLTIWITEVRPALKPDLVRPDGEATILLSALTVVPAASFDGAHPAIDAFAVPDDEGRPYLAPAQLIQELVQMGGGVTTVLAGSPIDRPVAPPLLEFASVSETGAGAARSLLLWPHLPLPLVLPGTVEVSRNGGAPVAFATAPGPLPGTTRLSPPGGAPLVDRELLDLRLDLTRLRVRDAGAGIEIPLLTWLPRTGVDLLDRRGDLLVLHHEVAPTPPPQVPPKTLPVRELVTVTGDAGRPSIELWWHVDKVANIDRERVKALPDDAVQVLAEVESALTPVNIPFQVAGVQHNVFRLNLDRQTWEDGGRKSPYLRVLVRLERISLSEFGGNVIDYAASLGVVVEDAQEGGRLLALWARLPDKQ